jgi:hypothetical protein
MGKYVKVIRRDNKFYIYLFLVIVSKCLRQNGDVTYGADFTKNVKGYPPFVTV